VSILERVNSPQDIKGLTEIELQQLAEEIRQQMVSTVSSNGGHLASNLGVVELTIALHRVFNSPTDKIIWDVGHQSYVHKLLTGRREQFNTLRQYGGLSGYTARGESEHDPFGAGHASTSVSAALGIAVARDFAGDNYHVIAVIGDGAITGGMAFEALNQAGHLGNRLIVILNDNGMSISPTVGALARMLNKVRMDRRYPNAKERGKHVIDSLPLGRQIWKTGRTLKSHVKGFIMPMMIWEELGFTYLGPVDGHSIHDLEKALRQAAAYNSKPILIHVCTTKGKGYQPAEGNATYFHGVAPKNPNPAAKVIPSYSEIFARTTLNLMRSDPKIVAITPAMPEGNYLSIVNTEFPKRVFDVGICEQHAVTFAAGLATQGYKPIVAIYSTFLQRAFDQIIHDVCIQDLPVVFAMDRAGIVGDDGKTHQGTFDISYLTPIPNLIVSAPKDENELQHLLFTAVNSPHPMAVRYPRTAGVGVEMDAELRQIPIGRGELLRDGTDAAIIAIGNTVYPALTAAQTLSADNIEIAVLNARFAKPLDNELICDIARRVKCVITVEENALVGGFGSSVTALLQSAGINVPVRSLGIADEFVEHGGQPVLRQKYNLDAAGIAAQTVSLIDTVKANPNLLTGIPGK